MQPSTNIINFSSSPLYQSPLFLLYAAANRNQKYYAKIFNKKIINNQHLSQTLEYNYEALTSAPQFLFPKHFLKVYSESFQNDQYILLTETYQYKLDQFIRKKGALAEEEAMIIFSHIVKATYSFLMAGYEHNNLRADHFVFSENCWKLQSFVLNPISTNLQSQYVSQKNHQPPEVIEGKELTSDELDDKIVWDLGNILIFMLTGKHLLDSPEALSKFKGKPFSFTKLGISDEQFSEEIRITLGKMCHYDAEKRTDIKKFFKLKLFSKEVAEHFRKHIKEMEGQKSNEPIFPQPKGKLHSKVRRRSIIFEPSQINQSKKSKVHSYFKTQLEKCQIMLLSQNQESMIQGLFPQQTKTEALAITRYCIYFAISIVLREIFEEGQKNKILSLNATQKQYASIIEYVSITEEDLQLYLTSLQYQQFKKLVKSFHSQVYQKFLSAQEQIKKLESTQIINSKTEKFFKSLTPEKATFSVIKQAYRKTIFMDIYSLVAKKCQKTQNQQWGKLCCKIVFVLAIDKLFIPDTYYENFYKYFQWCLENHETPKLTKENYVKYLEKLSIKRLGEESSQVLKKFYSF